MTLIRRKNKRFFTTGTRNAKVREAEANPMAEVCVMMRDKDLVGSVRLTGTLGAVATGS